VLGGLLGVVAGACTGPAAYACSSDAQCIDGGAAGYCEASGYCSFDDGTCASGRRYGHLAPAELAGECTMPGVDEGTGSAGGTSVDTSAGTSGPSPPTTTPSSESSTTLPVDPPTSSESTAESSFTTSGVETDGPSSSSGGPVVPTCTPVFVDDFEDGVLDPSWSSWASAGCAYGESGGAMNFSIAPSATEWLSAGLTVAPGPIAGGYVRVELVPFDPPLDVIGVWLTLYDDECELQIAAEGSVVHGMADGEWFDGVSVATDEPLWLQLRIDLDAVAYWEWSTDGEDWNEAHTEPTPCGTRSMQSALFAGGFSEEATAITRSVASYERCDPP
jgi:hypothetical protein